MVVCKYDFLFEGDIMTRVLYLAFWLLIGVVSIASVLLYFVSSQLSFDLAVFVVLVLLWRQYVLCLPQYDL